MFFKVYCICFYYYFKKVTVHMFLCPFCKFSKPKPEKVDDFLTVTWLVMKLQSKCHNHKSCCCLVFVFFPPVLFDSIINLVPLCSIYCTVLGNINSMFLAAVLITHTHLYPFMINNL